MTGIIDKFLSRIISMLSDVEKRHGDEIIRSLNLESDEELNIRFIGGKIPALKVGRGTYINGIDLYCWDSNVNVTIGRYCSIADKVTIIAGGEHDKHWVSTYPFIPRWNIHELKNTQEPRFKGEISIGNDVWISNNAVLLSGISIADGAIIGAGSVVTRDIPPYGIAAGNPARVIKMRFPEEIIMELQKIKWWEWDEKKIKDNMPLFKNVAEFLSQNKDT